MQVKKTEEKPLTLSHLVAFFERAIEPRFRALETRIDKMDGRFDEIDQRFDGLYKKFEDLRQEYLITNEQMKRMEKGFVTNGEFKNLETRVSSLEQQVTDIEQRIVS